PLPDPVAARAARSLAERMGGVAADGAPSEGSWRDPKVASMTDRPWLASYPDGVAKTLEPYEETSLYSLLEDAAGRFPEAPAIAFWLPGAPMAKTISYRELLRQGEQVGRVRASVG